MIFKIIVKVDAICLKILTIKDLFHLKAFPCGQEPCNLGSCAQKLERVCKGNDFEVLDPRPEIKFHAPIHLEFKTCNYWYDPDVSGTVPFYQDTAIGLN